MELSSLLLDTNYKCSSIRMEKRRVSKRNVNQSETEIGGTWVDEYDVGCCYSSGKETRPKGKWFSRLATLGVPSIVSLEFRWLL